MNRLISIIGPAPSELPPEAWLIKHTTERNRVRDELEAFTVRTQTKKTSVKKPSKKKAHNLIFAALAEAGVTLDELEAHMKKEEKNGVNNRAD